MLDKLKRNYKKYKQDLSLREILIRRIIVVGIVISIISLLQIVFATSTIITAIPMLALLIVLLLGLYITFFYGKVETAAVLIGLVSSGIVFPVVFVLNDGIHSGAAIYFVLGMFYAIGMFHGKKMVFFISYNILCDYAVYIYAVKNPDKLLSLNSESEAYFDSFFAVILVGVLIGSITKYQIREFDKARLVAVQQKEEAIDISSSKTSFFANMSHEIRTPINTIVGLNEMILRDPTVSDDAKENATNIQNASHMLLSLVNDILDLSKIDSAMMDIMPVAYRTEQMFLDVISMMTYQFKIKNLDFVIDIDSKLPSGLFGDDNRIKQILVNLLTNAAKYTEKGTVTLTVRYDSVNNGFIKLVISVSDTGIGIKKANIKTLFDSFTRVESGETRSIEGTGLGLSICKQLADLMNGELTVDSIYGKGSTFTLTLEQKVIDSAPIQNINFKAKLGNKAEYGPLFKAPEAHILVVDDNEMNRSVIIKLLCETGVQFDEAMNGRQALNLTAEYKYDLILMDYLMPDMNGAETTREIRKQADGLCNNAPIIVVTADLSYISENNFDDFGFTDFIEKPFTGALLEEKVLKYLSSNVLEYIKPSESEEDLKIYNITNHKIKKKIAITADCLADIPKEFKEKYDIKLMYLFINTENGRYADIKEIDADSLSTYIVNKHIEARAVAASVEEYEEFFNERIHEADYVIHIGLASHIGDSYNNALEASKGFGHVTVIDSKQISVGIGLLAIRAAELARSGVPADEIVENIINIRDDVHSAFIMPHCRIFYERGYTNKLVALLIDALRLHPVIKPVDSNIKIRGIYGGRLHPSRKKFINTMLKKYYNDSNSIVLVTQGGVSYRGQREIFEEINKIVDEDKIFIQKCSVTNACFSGFGNVGIAIISK